MQYYSSVQEERMVSLIPQQAVLLVHFAYNFTSKTRDLLHPPMFNSNEVLFSTIQKYIRVKMSLKGLFTPQKYFFKSITYLAYNL